MLAAWFFVVGAILIVMAFASRLVQRLPVSAAIVYLLLGVCLGPLGLKLLVFDPIEQVAWIEAITEVAVLISLFTVGLKIEVSFSRSTWRVPLRLATLGMVLSIALITVLAVLVLGLPWPLALLLGAVLAPTDPVLASDVQVRHRGDHDELRFALTAEGGINDGAAFPAVMLGLAWLGVHEGGSWLWRWAAVDLLWATAAGLLVGWICGQAVARVTTWFRQRGTPLQFEEFLVLGVIALAYGIALIIKAYGFLAVLTAGLGIAEGERRARQAAHEDNKVVTASRLLALSEQFERLAEVVVVLLVGALMATIHWTPELIGFALAVLLLARPLAVMLSVPGGAIAHTQRRLIAWFGIRGIGSMYYLAFALHHGLPSAQGQQLLDATLIVVAVSIFLHGFSATPLMERYQRRRERKTAT